MDRAQVESLSGAELVAAYNKLPGVKRVKRFATREDGVKRLLAALGEQPAAAPATPATPAPRKGRKAQPSPAPAPAAPVVEAQPEEPSKPSERSYSAAPGGKLPRAESKRGRLLEMLRQKQGATAAEICERFGWKANDAKDALYLLAKKNGVGVACDAAGRWRAQ